MIRSKKGVSSTTVLFVVGLILGVLILMLGFKIFFSFLSTNPTERDLNFISSIIERIKSYDQRSDVVKIEELEKHQFSKDSFLFLEGKDLCYCPRKSKKFQANLDTYKFKEEDCSVKPTCFPVEKENVSFVYLDFKEYKTTNLFDPQTIKNITLIITPRAVFFVFGKKGSERSVQRFVNFFYDVKELEEYLSGGYLNSQNSGSLRLPNTLLKNSNIRKEEKVRIDYYKDINDLCLINITFLLKNLNISLGPYGEFDAVKIWDISSSPNPSPLDCPDSEEIRGPKSMSFEVKEDTDIQTSNYNLTIVYSSK